MAAERGLALVTGASAGIGQAFARALARRGYRVALVARRLDRLEALAAELNAASPNTAFAIAADLSRMDAHVPIMEALAARGETVEALVNNAGYSVAKSYAATTWQEQRDFIMTLVMAVAGLTHAVIPGMLARGHGRIINVGSMAALSPGGAGHTLYPAAKSFVAKMTLSLDAELRDKGIFCTCVHPGFTESEFQQANGMEDVMRKKGGPPVKPMRAEDVVAATLDANARGQTIVIPGMENRFAAAMMKYLPDGVVTPIIRRAAAKYKMPD